MMEKDFANLVESIKEAGLIKAGKLLPGRRFEYSALDIEAIQEKLKNLSQKLPLELTAPEN